MPGIVGLVAMVLVGAVSVSGSAADDKSVGLIFDTDICGDCDDVLALAMIHSLESRGACKLLAVTVSADHDQAAPFVDAVNTFFHRGNVPIGVVGKGGVQEKSGFLELIDKQDDGQPRYPHRLKSGKDAPPAVEVLRKALADRPDGSVAIVQVGFSTNLAKLLDSPADAISPLNGEELVRKKVKLLSLMAGAFEPIEGNRHFLEYNVVKDVPAARKLADRWPSPRVWSGFEIGIALPYPAVSIERDYAYVKHHPAADAYIARNPPPHERPTWDLTSVLYAAMPDRGYFDLSPPGSVVVEADGTTRFSASADGRDRYLVLPVEKRARVLEALVQLSSQPPGGRRRIPPQASPFLSDPSR